MAQKASTGSRTISNKPSKRNFSIAFPPPFRPRGGVGLPAVFRNVLAVVFADLRLPARRPRVGALRLGRLGPLHAHLLELRHQVRAESVHEPHVPLRAEHGTEVVENLGDPVPVRLVPSHAVSPILARRTDVTHASMNFPCLLLPESARRSLRATSSPVVSALRRLTYFSLFIPCFPFVVWLYDRIKCQMPVILFALSLQLELDRFLRDGSRHVQHASSRSGAGTPFRRTPTGYSGNGRRRHGFSCRQVRDSLPCVNAAYLQSSLSGTWRQPVKSNAEAPLAGPPVFVHFRGMTAPASQHRDS